MLPSDSMKSVMTGVSATIHCCAAGVNTSAAAFVHPSERADVAAMHRNAGHMETSSSWKHVGLIVKRSIDQSIVTAHDKAEKATPVGWSVFNEASMAETAYRLWRVRRDLSTATKTKRVRVRRAGEGVVAAAARGARQDRGTVWEDVIVL